MKHYLYSGLIEVVRQITQNISDTVCHLFSYTGILSYQSNLCKYSVKSFNCNSYPILLVGKIIIKFY